MTHRVYIKEEFFDYNKFVPFRNWDSGEKIELYIYRNPSQSEMKKYVPEGARGYIDPEGNLYIEGYEEKPNESSIIHSDLLGVLAEKLPFISSGDYVDEFGTGYGGRELEFGICVQADDRNPNVFYISESIQNFDWRNIEELFKLAHEKNPSLTFKK